MNGVDFAAPGRIVFGAGTRHHVGQICAPFGSTALVVTGHTPERSSWLLPLLEAQQIRTVVFSVEGEPTVSMAQDGAAAARAVRCDMVVAVGGGSVIDAGKAIAALATNRGDIFDYLEVVGRGQPLSRPPIPFVAMPTTAGTGSEATRNAVLSVTHARVKVSLRSPWMLAKVAIVDPDLSRALPPSLTATSGLDALTQLIEAYVSIRANAMTDAFCVDGMRLVASALRPAFHARDRGEARDAMARASLWSGIALANAGLGAVHGLAGPIGGAFGAPHGAVCAALLPHVFAANVRVCRAKEGRPEMLDRFSTVARLVTGNGAASAETAISWLTALVDELEIPSLRHHGIADEDAAALAGQARLSNSMKGNPVDLTVDDLAAIVQAAR